jgi:hypothetical protein
VRARAVKAIFGTFLLPLEICDRGRGTISKSFGAPGIASGLGGRTRRGGLGMREDR